MSVGTKNAHRDRANCPWALTSDKVSSLWLGYQRRELGNCPRVVLPRDELHPKWAGFRFALRTASPPSDVGVTWSALNDCGVLGAAFQSIGLPHSQHGVLARWHSARKAACSLRHGRPSAGIVTSVVGGPRYPAPMTARVMKCAACGERARYECMVCHVFMEHGVKELTDQQLLAFGYPA